MPDLGRADLPCGSLSLGHPWGLDKPNATAGAKKGGGAASPLGKDKQTGPVSSLRCGPHHPYQFVLSRPPPRSPRGKF